MRDALSISQMTISRSKQGRVTRHCFPAITINFSTEREGYAHPKVLGMSGHKPWILEGMLSTKRSRVSWLVTFGGKARANADSSFSLLLHITPPEPCSAVNHRDGVAFPPKVFSVPYATQMASHLARHVSWCRATPSTVDSCFDY
jgi:hypothetical protein